MQSHRFLSILSTFFLLTIWASALSWPNLSQLDPNGVIIARQNNNNAQSTSSGSNPSSSNQPQQTSSASASQGNSATSGSGSASATITSGTSRASGSSTGSISGSKVGNSTRTSAIDPRLPPGGIQMLTPAPLAGMTFVKVGDQVTFAWNYTSLSVPPSYVDVVATNTVNHLSYTIAANASWASNQTVVWDTSDPTNTIPFVVASYTLMIYDAASDPTTVPSAGYLGAFSNYVFGVYTPQPRVDKDQFVCSTCSGAMSMHERQALSVILGTCMLTILSFTWFASGFGLF